MIDPEDIPFGDPPWTIDAADLLAEPDPGPTEWLVENLIVDQALIAAVGRWKATKSYAMLDICISIATGRPAFGRLAIPNPGPVVFVNEESGRAALWRRLDALCRGRGTDPEELRGRLLVAPNARVKLDDADWQDRLIELGAEIRPRLFVFDPLARMKAAKRKENEQSDMAPLIDFMRLLRDESGAAVAFVHHQGHQGDHMRGASDLETAWETRLRWKRDGQSPLIDLESEHREAEAGEPLRYRIGWDSETRSMRFNAIEQNEPGVPPLADRVVDWLREHPKSKARDVAKGVEVRAADVDRELIRLVDTGALLKGRSGNRDKLGRELRDEVYSLPETLDNNLRDGASQTLFADTPGTSHGTSHNHAGRTRTSHDHDHAEPMEKSGLVPRPETGTNQDEPHTGHRGSVARPVSIETGGRDEPPDEPPEHPNHDVDPDEAIDHEERERLWQTADEMGLT